MPLASSPNRGLGLIAVFGALASFVQGIHLDHLKRGTIMIHPYYVGFYMASYQDGFRRRALVGSLVRLFFPHQLNVVWLNVAALLVLGLVLTAALSAFVRLCDSLMLPGRALAFAFCASPVVAVLVEVIGDTLQIAFLVFLAVLLLSAAYVRPPALRLALGLAALVTGFFIHEASIFFLAPCVPFLVRPWPRLRDFLLPGLTAVACFLLAMHWSNLAPHLTYQVKLFHFAGPLAEQVDTPNFRVLLHLEHELYFGTRGAELSFAMKCVKTCSLVFVTLVALANCLSTYNLRRMLYTLSFMAVFSLPLYCIAHDWGRFFAYSVVLAMLLTAFAQYRDRLREDPAPTRHPMDRLTARLQKTARLEHVQLAALFLLLTTVVYDNFEKIMLTPPVTTFFAILVAGSLYRRYAATRGSPATG